MIIKKYKAPTEKEAVLMAKDDLGPEAIVMNVKTIKPGGIFKVFKKTKVELTAAIDDNISQESGNKETSSSKETYRFGDLFAGQEASGSAIEEKINNIAKLLEEQMIAAKQPVKQEIESHNLYGEKIFEKAPVREIEAEPENEPKSRIIDLICNQLIENDVKKKFVDNIISEMDCPKDSRRLDNILSSVYQKIVLKLGEIKPLSPSENKPKIIFFIGNTGVGKTTTVAKLASKSKLEDKLKVALFSVDTYRIAAIEQLKTYANIINAPMEVIYTPEDMGHAIEKYSDYDYIFVDTAGRSHQDKKQKKDLCAILNSVGDYEKEVYLVVSVAVKYSDLVNIAKAYSDITEYKLIFTKLDETTGIGSILNLKMELDKDLSYVTWGQNVPDDIGVINPQVIAKKLLGGEK